ncbi:hypothetical protein IFR04_011482 [Cadophora malorum]|uniref:Peptidase A1 domain-containing protein n=1 Tax=Cadophora malorum TaxID=108018 RepID=A0A8H7TAQ2_9HELO|nr:hypothetical protein IFR04_011482 [Cadophora malorum]
MHFLTLSSTFLYLLIFILLSTLAPLDISATCTNWTRTRDRWYDGLLTAVSPSLYIPLESLACPLSTTSNTTCTISRKTYPITVPRRLNISATEYNLSDAEFENIFSLASTSFGLLRTNDSAPPPFISRNTTVSSEDLSGVFVDVEPGKNRTLYWVPYLLYSYGILGECANGSERLNGVGLLGNAPYLWANEMNVSVVRGSFAARTENLTVDEGAGDADDDENGAGRLRGDWIGRFVGGAMAVLFSGAMFS